MSDDPWKDFVISNQDVDNLGISAQDALNKGPSWYEAERMRRKQLRRGQMYGMKTPGKLGSIPLAPAIPFWPQAEPVPVSTTETEMPPEGKYDVKVNTKTYVQGTSDSASYWLFTCTTEIGVPLNFITYRDVKDIVGQMVEVRVEHRGGGKYHARPKL